MKSLPRSRTTSGFTLIEVLIVSGLLAMIFISVSSLFLTSLASGLRTSLWQELRSEGTFALSQMTYLMRNSTGIISPNPCDGPSDTLIFDNPDTTKSQVFTITGSSGNQILVLETVDDAVPAFTNIPTSYLTSGDITVQHSGSLNFFDCHQAGDQPYVTISFQLVKEADSINDVTQQFRRTVFLRNSQ